MTVFLLAASAAGCSPSQSVAERVQDNRLASIENKVDKLESARQLPAPMSKEEYDQIPDGTRFLAPDGTVRIKGKAK